MVPQSFPRQLDPNFLHPFFKRLASCTFSILPDSFITCNNNQFLFQRQFQGMMVTVEEVFSSVDHHLPTEGDRASKTKDPKQNKVVQMVSS